MPSARFGGVLLRNCRTRQAAADKTAPVTTEPRATLVASCIALLERLTQFSEKTTKTLRAATRACKEAEAARGHLRETHSLAVQLWRDIVAFFRDDRGTAEAC